MKAYYSTVAQDDLDAPMQASTQYSAIMSLQCDNDL